MHSQSVAVFRQQRIRWYDSHLRTPNSWPQVSLDKTLNTESLAPYGGCLSIESIIIITICTSKHCVFLPFQQGQHDVFMLRFMSSLICPPAQQNPVSGQLQLPPSHTEQYSRTVFYPSVVFWNVKWYDWCFKYQCKPNKVLNILGNWMKRVNSMVF